MKKVFYLVAIATFVFFSCKKEVVSPVESQNSVTLQAALEQLVAPSKADINANNELVWAKGDKIGIFVDDESWGKDETYYYRQNPFTLDGDGGSTTGSFKWDFDEGNFTSQLATVAYFPWQGRDASGTFNNVYNGVAYFKLPSYYDNYTSGKMLTPLVAEMNYNVSKYDPIEFKHAGAAVKVTINNLPAGAKSIGMKVDGKQIHGGFHVTPNNTTPAALELDGTEDTGQNEIWLNYEPAAAERAFTFLFPVPELAQNSSLIFKIYDENNILVWTRTAKTPERIDRAEVLDMQALDITPYRQFNSVSTYFVHGALDGSTYVNYPMVTDGSKSIAKGLTFSAGGKFTVSDGNVYIPEGWGNDWVVNTAGTYDIIFDPSGSTTDEKIKVVASKCLYPDAGSNVTFYVHPTTAVVNELCFKSDVLGTASWPGTPFTTTYEIIAGQKFYKMEFPASKVWGKTITDLYVVDRDNWSSKSGGTTLTFSGNKKEYYIVATKDAELELLANKPAEPTILINGVFTDWNDVSGNSKTNTNENTVLMKGYSDGTNLFVYLKLTVKDGYPVDLSSGRYFRLFFDKDNKSTTGKTDWYRPGAETIPAGIENFLVYFNHDGTVDKADIQGIGTNYEIKVVDNDSGKSLEVELKVPLSVLGRLTADDAPDGTANSDEIVIYCLGYRGGDYSEFTGSVASVMIPTVTP